MWDVIGAIGGSLLSKALGGGGTSANKQYGIWQQQARYSNMLAEQYDSKAIQRRVADAKAAGVSPIAALGMTPGNGVSMSTGGIDYQSANGDNSMGQNIGRAIAANADPMVRLNQRLLSSQIDGQDLDNEYKRSQIARMKGQVGPPMPGIVTDGSDADGANEDWKKYKLSDGSDFLGPSGALAQMMENAPLHGGAVALRDVLHRLKNIGSSFSRWRHNSQTYNARKRFGRYPGSDYR